MADTRVPACTTHKTSRATHDRLPHSRASLPPPPHPPLVPLSSRLLSPLIAHCRYDANGDGVLGLDEFQNLCKEAEGLGSPATLPDDIYELSFANEKLGFSVKNDINDQTLVVVSKVKDADLVGQVSLGYNDHFLDIGVLYDRARRRGGGHRWCTLVLSGVVLRALDCVGGDIYSRQQPD